MDQELRYKVAVASRGGGVDCKGSVAVGVVGMTDFCRRGEENGENFN